MILAPQEKARRNAEAAAAVNSVEDGEKLLAHIADTDARRLAATLRAELKSRHIDASRIMHVMDVDRSGSVSVKEFSEGLDALRVRAFGTNQTV